MMHMPILKTGPVAEGSTAAVEAVWAKRRLGFDRELTPRQRQRRVQEIGQRQISQLPAVVACLTPAEHAKVCDIIGAALMRHREAERASHKNGGAR
jgi:hypothetical protein